MKKREYYEKDWSIFARCSICREYKDISCFWKSSNCFLWIDTRCKDCRKEYRKANSEAIKQKAKEYRDTHKDEAKKYRTEYYKANKDIVLKKCKEYRDNHKEQKRQSNFEWRLKNKDYAKQYSKDYYYEHREELSQSRRWKKYNRIIDDRIREQQRIRYKKYNNSHGKTDDLIKGLWIRPKVCPICWCSWLVEAHHPDYSKRYNIIFCCRSCHHRIHSWWIKCPSTINLLDYK